MSCLFRLDHYQIEYVAVAQNEGYDASLPSHTGDISSSINIAPNKKDPSRYRLRLEVQIKPTAKREKDFFPYQVAIKGRGFFAIKGAGSPGEIDTYLRQNGAAILYGLLRAQVAQITAQSVHGQFLLPTMNFAEAAQKAQLEAKPKKAPKTEAVAGGGEQKTK